jgi:hypothetical protein
MVKNLVKLSKVRQTAKERAGEGKKKEKKLKVIQRKEKIGKLIEEELNKGKKKRGLRKQGGILGNLETLGMELDKIQCEEKEVGRNKLSKKEKCLIE